MEPKQMPKLDFKVLKAVAEDLSYDVRMCSCGQHLSLSDNLQVEHDYDWYRIAAHIGNKYLYAEFTSYIEYDAILRELENDLVSCITTRFKD